jgi:hypothetical protein
MLPEDDTFGVETRRSLIIYKIYYNCAFVAYLQIIHVLKYYNLFSMLKIMILLSNSFSCG